MDNNNIEDTISLSELLVAFERLLDAAMDYVEYKHDGDPYSEDARVMNEMELDDLKRDGSLAHYSQILSRYK